MTVCLRNRTTMEIVIRVMTMGMIVTVMALGYDIFSMTETYLAVERKQ